MLIKHNVNLARFESNAAGGKVAQIVQERVRGEGGKTRIETKWTQANKETKIQVEQPWVVQHCLFRDDSVLKGSEWSEYREMLRLLCGYSLIGRNKHDDVPDAFAQLSQYIQGIGGNKAEIVKRPF
jgi:predicted phage terminase large subunit-like protein